MRDLNNKLSSFPKDAQVEAGILTPITYPDTGDTVASIASKNIHGDKSARIPPRNFIDECRDDLRKKQDEFVKRYVKNYFQNKDTDGLVEELGITSANLLRTSVIELKDPPNAKKTIEMKGFNDPLIHTGLLRDTIDWRKA